MDTHKSKSLGEQIMEGDFLDTHKSPPETSGFQEMGLPRICGCPELTNVGRRVCTEFVMQMMGADVFVNFLSGMQ